MTAESDDSADIKALLDSPAGQPFDPDQSLRRVLVRASRQSSARDIMSFFFSWLWVLFAGFGASLHQAGTRARLQRAHAQARRNPE